jgi:hypothetical protein
MKKFILATLVILSIVSVQAAIYGGWEYCEGQGYTVGHEELLDGSDVELCIFDDDSSCNLHEFYDGTCGQEYLTEVRCAELGEYVWSDFQECCAGKAYLPFGALGQESCTSATAATIGNIKYNPVYWAGILLMIIVIGYLLYRKCKKN